VLFADRATYEAAREAVTRDSVALAYGIKPSELTDFVYFDEGFAIKATLVRPHVAGAEGVGETDLYGSGQYAPLLNLDVPYDTDGSCDQQARSI
jgi:hypothetical protein